MRLKSIFALAILVSLLLAAGCGGPECNKTVSSDKIDAVDQTQLATDAATIDAYLTTNNVANAQKNPSGISYVITKAVSGGTPCIENQITVVYDVKLIPSLKAVDSSKGAAVPFKLSQLILAWQIMFPQFPKGTKAVLYVPSGFAYGATATGAIPANSNLIFTIELVGIR